MICITSNISKNCILITTNLALIVFGDISPYPQVENDVDKKYNRLISFEKVWFFSFSRPFQCFESLKKTT